MHSRCKKYQPNKMPWDCRFFPRIPQSGPGSLRIFQRKWWVAVSPTPQPIGNAWTPLQKFHPPPKKENGQDWPLQSYHNFSNLRGGSKRPIRWYQNQGGYSDVPLGCKQMLHCQSFLQIAEHLKMNLLEMLQVVPISGRFYRCKHVSWPQVVRQGRSSGQTALIRRCAELAWLLQIFVQLGSGYEVRFVNCG